MAIAGDRVDAELVEKPRRWRIGEISKFMVIFGVLSSLFDFATFGLLLDALRVTRTGFRTGWFAKSIVSAILVLLVIRTRRPLYGSPPGRWLVANTLFVGLAALLLTGTRLGAPLGFSPISPALFICLGLITFAYVAAAEILKRQFYRQKQSASDSVLTIGR